MQLNIKFDRHNITMYLFFLFVSRFEFEPWVTHSYRFFYYLVIMDALFFKLERQPVVFRQISQLNIGREGHFTVMIFHFFVSFLFDSFLFILLVIARNISFLLAKWRTKSMLILVLRVFNCCCLLKYECLGCRFFFQFHERTVRLFSIGSIFHELSFF